MFFRDIPYKANEKAFLIKQVREDKVPHAQIFLGKEGSGALSLALAFISYLVCTQREELDSCGQCAACKQSHKFLYPDIHWSFPFIKAESKNAKDTISDDFLGAWRKAILSNPNLGMIDWLQTIGADKSKPNINVAECNSIIKKLSLRSYMEGPKILIMWLPEYLGKEGNRLLKLIEEPTPDTLIILVAEREDQILNTILSRCQLVKVLPYKLEEVSSHLQNAYGLDQTESYQIAKLSEGNISKAIKSKEGISMDLAEYLFDWLRVSYKGDAIEMQEMSINLAGWRKDQQRQFLQYGLKFLRELLFYILTGNLPNLTDAEFATAERMAKIVNQDKIQLIADVLESGLVNINRNANLKISYMADTIRIGDILRNIDVSLPKEINFV